MKTVQKTPKIDHLNDQLKKRPTAFNNITYTGRLLQNDQRIDQQVTSRRPAGDQQATTQKKLINK